MNEIGSNHQRLAALSLVVIMILSGLGAYGESGIRSGTTVFEPCDQAAKTRGPIDFNESFHWVTYSVHDSDGDTLNDSVRIAFGVVTDGISESVRVNLTVRNETGIVQKQDLMEFTARRRAANLTKTYFDFRAGKTGFYSFELILMDMTRRKEEDRSNRTNVSLVFDQRRIFLSVSAVVDDLNGNGTRNDVLIRCTDRYSLPMMNATVYLDGWFAGQTDERGRFVEYNLSGDHHEVDVFYSSHHANTDFDIVFPLPEPMIVDPEPMDHDGDGYFDDVHVYARLPDSTPAFGASVHIGWSREIIGPDGYARFENLSGGWYVVEVTYRNRITASSSYYAEAPLEVVEMYFYYINGQAADVDGDGLVNDLEIYCDVDISGGATSRVNINATVFDEWAKRTAFSNTSYVTTGTLVENELFYVMNLTPGYYTLRYELFDPNWTLRDISAQEGAQIFSNDAMFNVDVSVNDHDNGSSMNDVMFYAHIRENALKNVTIKLHFRENGTEYRTNSTLSDGSVIMYDLPFGDYNFSALSGTGREMDWGNFSIYSLLPRTFQASDYLLDLGWDGKYDDFGIIVYDQMGAPDVNTLVIIRNMDGDMVRQGFTNDQNWGPGIFVAEDLRGGDYTFTAVHQGPLGNLNVSMGKFHSHAMQHDYYVPLLIEPVVFDGNCTGIRDDVMLRVNDTYGQPVDDVRVTMHNSLGTRYGRTDGNGTLLFHDMPGGYYSIYADKWSPYGPDYYGDAGLVSQGAVSFELRWCYHSVDSGMDFRPDDLRVSVVVLSSAYKWENATVLVSIRHKENGSRFLTWNETFIAKDYNGRKFIFNDTPIGNYSTEISLFDGNGTFRESTNLTGLSVFEARPVLNTDVEFWWGYWGNNRLDIRPYFAGRNIFTSNITLINSTGLVKSTEDDYLNYFDVWPDSYDWSVTEISRNLTDGGSLLVDVEYEFRYSLCDYDDDGYYDDLSIYLTRNGSGVHNATVEIRDSNSLLFLRTNPGSRNILIQNLSIGNYSFVISYEGRTLLEGRVHSYTNGYPNHPPLANISHPADGDVFESGSRVYFDAGNSTDGDINDTIYYTWSSDLDGLLSHDEHFNISTLSTGNHTITLYCDDGHYNNVSTSIRIRIIVRNIPPIADAGPDRSGFAGELLELAGRGTDADGRIVRYQWDFDGNGEYDWESGLDGRAAFNYSSTGSYRATLRVTDDRGASDTDPCNVTITYRNRPPVALAGDDLTLFTGEMCVLNGSGSYDPDEEHGDHIARFNWSCTNHEVELEDADTATPFFSSDVPNVYIFELTVEDTNGLLSSVADTVNVTILERPNRLPVADATRTARSALVGQKVILDGSRSRDSDGNVVGYDWACESHNGVTIENRTDVRAEFTAEEEDTYSFSLRVMDDRDGWSPGTYVNITVSEPVVVNHSPRVSVVTVNETYVFVPVSFSAEGSYDPNDDTNGNGRIDSGEKDRLRYSWDVDGDDEGDASGKRVSYTYTTPGSFNVRVTATDPGGLSDQMSFVILVRPENDPPEAAIDGGASLIFNIGDDIVLTGYSSYDPQEDEDGDGELSYEEALGLEFTWDADLDMDSDGSGDPADDEDGKGIEFRPLYEDHGEYRVGLTVTDGDGEIDRAEATVIVNSPPLQLSMEISANTEKFYVYQVIAFSGIAVDPDGDRKDMEYYWYSDSDGTFEVTGRSVDIAFTESGTFTVKLRVEDRYGAAAETTRTITILPPPETLVEQPLILVPMDGDRLRENTITVEATSFSRDVIWLEGRVGGRRWVKMSPKGDDDWTHTYTVPGYGKVLVEVRGALRDWSGAVVYTAIDRVNVTIIEEVEEPGEQKESGLRGGWMLVAAGAALLILLLAVVVVVRGRRDRDMEQLKDELVRVRTEKEKRRRAAEPREREAPAAPKKIVSRKTVKARARARAAVKTGGKDSGEGGDDGEMGKGGENSEKSDEKKPGGEAADELFIACPGCGSEFHSEVTGWPHVAKCPECGARGRITEKMAAATA